MTRVSAKNNKQRGKADELRVARKLGCTRHPADTGGGEDLRHPELCFQVKGGLRVINSTIRDGMQAAKVEAVGLHKLPAVVVVDRSGTRLREYVVFELEPWCAWYGYGPKEEAE